MEVNKIEDDMHLSEKGKDLKWHFFSDWCSIHYLTLYMNILVFHPSTSISFL